jgi:hypothetical protein
MRDGEGKSMSASVELVALNPEDVARLHADEHPGYELASFGEVGLPLFELRFQAHVLAHKRINPFSEFVLRGAAQGLRTDELATLLGLGDRVLEATLVELVQRGMLALDGEGKRVYVTESGREVLEDAEEIVPEPMPIHVMFDPILGEVLEPYGDFLTPRELKERGMREISIPARLRPDLHQVNLRDVEQVVRQMGGGREQTSDILALRSLRRFRAYRPAVALVYTAIDGDEVTVDVALDGQVSERHSEALVGLGIKRKLGIRESGFQPDAIVPDDDLSPELSRLVSSERPSSELRELERVLRQKRNAEVAGRPEQADDEEFRKRAEAAEKALARADVRPVQTYDHPRYLRDALVESKELLIIVSPWLRSAVVNDEFLELLENALEHQVSVHIGWGISKDEQREPNADPAVLDQFRRLSKRFPNLNVRRLGSAHSKVLVSDRRYVIVTSFNWLSFRGDPKRTYRYEHGTLVARSAYVETEAERWITRLTSR